VVTDRTNLINMKRGKKRIKTKKKGGGAIIRRILLVMGLLSNVTAASKLLEPGRSHAQSSSYKQRSLISSTV